MEFVSDILILIVAGLATAVMYVCIVDFGKVATGIARAKDCTDKMRSTLSIAFMRFRKKTEL